MIKVSLSKYLNNAKGAFSFTFDDGCYADSTRKTVEIFKEVEAKTGIKIKATSAQTVGFLHEGTIAMWKELFEQGYYDLASHSLDHCIGYNDETPEEKRLEDAEKSRDRLAEIYGHRFCRLLVLGDRLGRSLHQHRLFQDHHTSGHKGHARRHDQQENQQDDFNFNDLFHDIPSGHRISFFALYYNLPQKESRENTLCRFFLA